MCGSLRLLHEIDAPQERTRSSQQLTHAERFYQVVICAHLQAEHAVALLGAGGEHEDWGDALRPNAPAHLESVQPWQHPVQDDEVGGMPLEQAQGGQPVGGDRDGVAGGSELFLDERGELRLVFYEKDACHLFPLRGASPYDAPNRPHLTERRAQLGASSHFCHTFVPFSAHPRHPHATSPPYADRDKPKSQRRSSMTRDLIIEATGLRKTYVTGALKVEALRGVN